MVLYGLKWLYSVVYCFILSLNCFVSFDMVLYMVLLGFIRFSVVLYGLYGFIWFDMVLTGFI